MIPPTGYITPHYHDFEETITLLTGCAEVQIGDVRESVLAPATLFIPPYALHGVTNEHDEPVHLLAFLATNEAKVIYPEDSELTPVVWEDEE
jgi:quercetin dioxygenase-like cupin family protein